MNINFVKYISRFSKIKKNKKNPKNKKTNKQTKKLKHLKIYKKLKKIQKDSKRLREISKDYDKKQSQKLLDELVEECREKIDEVKIEKIAQRNCENEFKSYWRE